MRYNFVIIEHQIMYHISSANPEVFLKVHVYTFDYYDCDVNEKVQLTTFPCLSSGPSLGGRKPGPRGWYTESDQTTRFEEAQEFQLHGTTAAMRLPSKYCFLSTA